MGLSSLVVCTPVQSAVFGVLSLCFMARMPGSQLPADTVLTMRLLFAGPSIILVAWLMFTASCFFVNQY